MHDTPLYCYVFPQFKARFGDGGVSVANDEPWLLYRTEKLNVAFGIFFFCPKIIENILLVSDD